MTRDMYSPYRTHANAYQKVRVESGVESADSHQLFVMLLDGYFECINRARGALQSGDVLEKGKAIGKAVRIVEEGLRSALDLQSGGQLAEDLNALYTYIVGRLTIANLKNDAAALDECHRLMQPVREAWVAIRPQVT
jgi:flagellar secretion chaperone FliS